AAAHIGAVGLFPCTEELADRFAELRPSRFCPIGRMQDPPWTWHNGGIPRLASLVKWVDFES
ncbi:MAG: acyl-CoA reductase, partial [Chthoniobacterales bacterium]